MDAVFIEQIISSRPFRHEPRRQRVKHRRGGLLQMAKVRELSPELLERAKKEVNEDPARREQDLQHIRDWLSKQPHISARTDDQWLLAFLRGCKFSLERTKEKLDTYYTMRTILPEFFSNRDPMLPEIQDILKIGIALPLPDLDDKGRRIVLVRIGSYEPSKVSFDTMFKVNFLMSDIMMMEDDALLINGQVQVLDFTNVTIAHALHVNPSTVKKISLVAQEGYPLRPKSINYYKPPPTFETVMAIFKSFMKEKLKRRIMIHGDSLESLCKEIPLRCLPQEYGGDAGPVADIAAAWKKKIESYRDFFLQDEKNKTDEKKRPGKPKTHEDMFGLEGSFRQLSVD